MSKQVDERVVSMQFDNKQFEANVKTSMTTIQKLKQSLNFKDSGKSLENLSKAANEVKFDKLLSGVETLEKRFSAMGIVGMRVIENLTDSAMQMVTKTKNLITSTIKQGGISRATNIENARFQLQGLLKDDEAVAAVMKNVSDSVDGTAYSLDAAAKVASQLAASGMRAGDEMFSSLRAVAGVAAMTNSSYEDIGRIFTQVAGQGRMMGDQLLQLSGRGMNAAATLAEQLGKTEQEVRDMVSKGQISFSTFASAMDNAFGEHAKKANETLNGAFSNVKSALARIGAEFVAPLIVQNGPLVQVLNTIREKVNDVKRNIVPFAELVTTTINKLATKVNAAISKLNIDKMFEKFSFLSRDFGASKIIKLVNGISKPIEKVTDTVKETVNAVTDLDDIVNKVIRGDFGNGAERLNKLTEAGQNYYKIQNKVNEALNNGFRFSEDQIQAQDKLLGVKENTVSETKSETTETVKLTDEKKKLIKELASMSDAQLRANGYTEEQIAAFRELRGVADKLGMPIDKLIDNIDELNGKWIIMDALKNIGNSIVSIFKAIGQAWKDIFPSSSTDTVFNIVAAFHKLSERMKVTDEDADKIKRTFKGLFAVLDLVSTLVGGGLRLALKATSYILSLFNLSLLDVTAILGDALVKFRDWVKGNNLITRAFETMAPYLKEFVSLIVEGIIAIKDWVVANEKITQGFKKILSYLREAGAGFKAWIEGAREAENIPVYIIQGLVNGLKNGISTVVSIAIELAKSIIQTVCGVLGIHSPSTEFYAIGLYIIQGLINGLKAGAKKVWDTVKSIGEAIVGVGKEIDYKYLGISTTALGLLIVLNKFTNAVTDIKEKVIDAGLGVVNSISSIFDSISKYVKARALKQQAKALLLLAVSIAALGATIYFISQIDTKSLIKGGIAIGVLAGMLIGLTVAMSKLDKLGVFSDKVGVMLLGMSVALLAMGKVATEIGKLEWEEIAKGIVFVGALELFIISLIAISKFAGTNAKDAGKMIFKIAGALLIMALVAKLAGNLRKDELTQGLKFIAVMGIFTTALVAVSLFAGKNASRAGTMILKIAGALLIMVMVAKIAGNMKPEELSQGLEFIEIMGIFTATLVAVSILAGKNASRAGNMILKIAIALQIMAKVVKTIGQLKPDEVEKGLKFIKTLGKFIVALVAVSLLAGKNASRAGIMMIGVAIAMGVMAQVVKMAGSIDENTLKQGLGVMAAFETFILALVAVSILAGKNAAKAGEMLLKVSVSLLILTGALFLIGQMDSKKLWKAVGVVAVLETLFAGLIAVTKVSQNANKTIIGLVATLTLLVSGLALLTTLNSDKLITSAESLSMVMVAMAAMIAATGQIKNTEGATKVLLQISLVVLMLVGVLGMIQTLNIEGNMGAVASISVLLVSMAASLALLGNTKNVSLKAVGAMALMGLVVAELAVVMKAMDKLNIDVSTKTVAQLSALLLAMSGALAILTVVGIGGAAAFVGIGALVTLIAAVGGLMIAIGALNDEFPAVADFVHNSIPILQDMGEGLGNFIGGLVGGVVAGAIDSLAGIGTSLSTFMENLQPFIEKVSAIDPDAMAGGEALAKMLLTLTAAELVSGLSKFLGVKDLGNLGSQLSDFGDAIIAFSDKLNNGDCINDKAVQKAAKAGEMMAKLQSSLYGTGGLKQDIFGEKDLGDFGSQMSKFADGIIAFATKVEVADINQDSVDAAAYAGETMATLQSKIKSQNGALQDIFGSQDLGDFGSQMSNFADGVVNFDKKLKANDGISSDLADQAAYAGNVMAELQNNTGAIGGVVKYFAGEKNLGTFGTQIALYGSALAAFSQVLSENPVDTTTVSIAKDCGLLMTELQTALPETHLFDGKMDLDDFGAKLMSFGKYMGVFANMTAQMDVSNLTTVSIAAKRLGEMTQSISAVDQTKIDEFDFEGIGNSIKTFCDSFDNVDASKVETAINSINKLVNTIKSMDGLNTNGVNTFKGILNSLSGDTVNLKGIGNSFSDDQIASFNSIGSSVVSAIASGMKSKSSEFTSIGHSILSSIKSSLNYNIQQFKTSGETIMSNFVSGIKGSRNTASSAFTSMMAFITLSLKGYYNNFYTIGGYLVTGFANGISASAYKAKAKAKDMAKDAEKAAREELQVHSPSKKLDKVGQYFGMGFANGIDKKSHLSVQAAKTMAASAIDSTKQTISRLGQILAMDVDAQPTIRPVMDLSDINSGVATMNGMLAMNPSVGVMTNIGAINASMRNRQNGNANDVISAINTLGKTLGNTRGDTYIIDGITYDDGSGINDAVQTLIRAARIERRM
uniref:Tail tape measure n=1 Tax=Siphoviridae sp. ctmYS12 TaxID=2825652 RepID=A0A8S5P610_9CAUD|nr:MAG TPA: tail tape measure [Siphoviridae sp. ctmYS12]